MKRHTRTDPWASVKIIKTDIPFIDIVSSDSIWILVKEQLSLHFTHAEMLLHFLLLTLAISANASEEPDFSKMKISQVSLDMAVGFGVMADVPDSSLIMSLIASCA